MMPERPKYSGASKRPKTATTMLSDSGLEAARRPARADAVIPGLGPIHTIEASQRARFAEVAQELEFNRADGVAARTVPLFKDL